MLGLALAIIRWVLPGVVEHQIEQRASAALGRSVTVQGVELRPWALAVELKGLVVGGASTSTDAAEPLLQVVSTTAELSLQSLWRLAPVVESLVVESPRLQFARTAPGHFDVDDLLDRLWRPRAPAAEPTGPLRVALYNLELRGGRIVFDDRTMGRRHELDALEVAIPFVSTLPAHVEVRVEPRVAFRVGDRHFDSSGHVRPFTERPEASLRVHFDPVELAPYAGYLPRALPLQPRSGRLGADLVVDFEQRPTGELPLLRLRGHVEADDLALHLPGGSPWLRWQRAQVDLKDVKPLERSVSIGLVDLAGIEVRLARDEGGRLVLPAVADDAGRAGGGPPASSRGAVAAADPHAWRLDLDELRVRGGALRWHDATIRPAADLSVGEVAASLRGLRWPAGGGEPAWLEASAALPASGSVTLTGRVDPLHALLEWTVQGATADAVGPYVAQVLPWRAEARLDGRGTIDWRAGDGAAGPPRLQVEVGQLSLAEVRLREGLSRGASSPWLSWATLELEGGTVDVGARRADIGRVTLRQPAVRVSRDRTGRWNPEPPWQPPAVPASDVARSASGAWTVSIAAADVDGGRLSLADEWPMASGDGSDKAARFEATRLKVALRDLAVEGDRLVRPLTASVSAAVAPRGSLQWQGRVTGAPLRADGRARVERLPLQGVAPYAAAAMNADLVFAEVGFTGTTAIQETADGLAMSLRGDASVANLDLRSLPTAQGPAGLGEADELLRWALLSLQGLSVDWVPAGRPRLGVASASLDDFAARLVITEDGRLNLQRVVGTPAPAATGAADGPAAAASGAGQAPAAAPRAPRWAGLDVDIGGIALRNGEVAFADRFIRPNYSVDLTELNGRIGAFRSGSRELAAVSITGRAARTALLEITGQINPTADPLALDLRARATDLELAPLSPYAGKYAGYAIERGKLSMDVTYRIDPDGKLEANNQIVLNQLTFGEKVDSPSATKLPVLLAVALLQDRHGVIDINLPISGSINDPQFSVGGLIIRVIVNLLTKVLTAPFTLLAGAGGPDLSVVPFEAGRSSLPPAAGEVIDRVAQALADRPTLRMTVTGTADPVAERDAMQRAALDRRLGQEWRRQNPGTADPPPADRRADLVRSVYRQTSLPNKPRNAFGIARDIPVEQMESLLSASVPITADTARELALERGITVRDALLAKGLAGDRLFVAAPTVGGGPGPAAAAASGAAATQPWTPRAQLSLALP